MQIDTLRSSLLEDIQKKRKALVDDYWDLIRNHRRLFLLMTEFKRWRSYKHYQSIGEQNTSQEIVQAMLNMKNNLQK